MCGYRLYSLALSLIRTSHLAQAHQSSNRTLAKHTYTVKTSGKQLSLSFSLRGAVLRTDLGTVGSMNSLIERQCFIGGGRDIEHPIEGSAENVAARSR